MRAARRPAATATRQRSSARECSFREGSRVLLGRPQAGSALDADPNRPKQFRRRQVSHWTGKAKGSGIRVKANQVEAVRVKDGKIVEANLSYRSKEQSESCRSAGVGRVGEWVPH